MAPTAAATTRGEIAALDERQAQIAARLEEINAALAREDSTWTATDERQQ